MAEQKLHTQLSVRPVAKRSGMEINMADKLEQTMKKIHIYLANCQESAYSSEELIVSKKRIFALLEELNYAVYEAMEEYEVTVAARDRGIAQAERQAADIKDEAKSVRRSCMRLLCSVPRKLFLR